jgi:hypothetical protein
MAQPTGTLAPPQLLHYSTWAADGVLHARYHQELTPAAIEYGCVQEIQATTALELTQEAARNRIRVWVWETRP